MPITLSGDGVISGLTATGISAVQNLPAGSVLQVVNAQTSTSVTNATNTYTDTTLTANITPKFATSKILILVSQNGCIKDGNNSNNMIDIAINRVGTGLINSFAGALGATNTALQNVVSASSCYLDSPATTSALTYKTQFASRNGTSSVSVQFAGVSVSTITLLEIAG